MWRRTFFRIIATVTVTTIIIGCSGNDTSDAVDPSRTSLYWTTSTPSLLTIRVGTGEPIGKTVLIGFTDKQDKWDKFASLLKQLKLESGLRDSMGFIAGTTQGKKNTSTSGAWDKFRVVGIADNEGRVSAIAIAGVHDPETMEQLGTVMFYTSDNTVKAAKSLTIDFSSITLGFDRFRGSITADSDWQESTKVILWTLAEDGSCKTSWAIEKDSTAK